MIDAGGLRSQRGFSLLELVVVIVLISVLLTLGIERLLIMKAQAERTAMEQVLSSIRSGLTIRLAELAVRSRLPQAAAMAGKNPINVLSEKPPNYLGELFGPDPRTLARGSWYFDLQGGVLCYLPESEEFFQSPLQPLRARFRIEPVFDDVNKNGRYDEGVDLLRGLHLAPLEAYSWNMRFAWPDWGEGAAPLKASGARGG